MGGHSTSISPPAHHHYSKVTSSMLLKVAVCFVLAVVTTVQSEDGEGYQDVGCWKARPPFTRRQWINLEGSDSRLDKKNWRKREDAVNKCYMVARDMGYSAFGVGRKGKCWGGYGILFMDQGKAKRCPANGKGYNAVVNAYMIDFKTTEVTEATEESTTPCGDSHCITRTHYCSAMHFQVSSLFSSLCHEREASGAMCTTDKECMSQKCTFVWSKFSMRCT